MQCPPHEVAADSDVHLEITASCKGFNVTHQVLHREHFPALDALDDQHAHPSQKDNTAT